MDELDGPMGLGVPDQTAWRQWVCEEVDLDVLLEQMFKGESGHHFCLKKNSQESQESLGVPCGVLPQTCRMCAIRKISR